MARPSKSGNRLRSASTDRLELRGALGDKVSRVVNFHRETSLKALHPFVETLLPQFFDDLRANLAEGLYDDGVCPDEIKSVGLLYRLAHLPFLQRKNNFLFRVPVRNVLFFGGGNPRL